MMKTKSNIPIQVSVAMLTSMLFGSCSDFISIPPPKTEIVSATVFNSDASAMAAVRGIYSAMTTDQSFTNGLMELYSGLSSDELANFSTLPEQEQFALANLNAQNTVLLNVFWKPAYKYINNANAILEDVENNTALSQETKDDAKGEALFIRAYCHFYLTNIFGDIPYITSTDYRINQVAVRLAQADVNDKIIADLLEAEALLTANYSFSNSERNQPNKFAASALLAKVYLYAGRYSEGEDAASSVIARGDLYTIINNPDSVFLANSNEAIWQLQPVTPEKSTGQAKIFLLVSAPTSVALSEQMIDAFEPGDKRYGSWVSEFSDENGTCYFPFKYKVYASTDLPEYSMELRLAEQYLILAECQTQLDKLNNAIQNLDVVRKRAGLALIADTNPGISKSDLLNAIAHERQIELMTECGNRWFDLKRTGKAEGVLLPLKPGWNTTDQLYPIPQSERLADPLLTQNSGY